MTLDACVTYCLAHGTRIPDQEGFFSLRIQEEEAVAAAPATGRLDSLHTRDFACIITRYSVIENPDTGTEYLLLAQLGQGGYGKVFKCQDLETREVVAMKVATNDNPSMSDQWCQPAFQKEKTILEKVSVTPTIIHKLYVGSDRCNQISSIRKIPTKRATSYVSKKPSISTALAVSSWRPAGRAYTTGSQREHIADHRWTLSIITLCNC
jgi:hypothetical protein